MDNTPADDVDAVDRFDEALHEAVRLHLEGDVLERQVAALQVRLQVNAEDVHKALATLGQAAIGVGCLGTYIVDDVVVLIKINNVVLHTAHIVKGRSE